MGNEKQNYPPLYGKKLLPNTLHDLLECHPPSKKHFCCTDECVDFKCCSILDIKLCVTGKSREIMYHKDIVIFGVTLQAK